MRQSILALLVALSVCSGALPAQAAVDFTWDTPTQVQLGGEFTFIEFTGLITNTGDERDSYAIHKSEQIPGDFIWSVSICVGDFCYAPFINDVVTSSIDPGNSVDVYVAITVGTELATGYGTLRVSSTADPTQSVERGFAAIHTSCDLLVIDDTEDPFMAFGHFSTVAGELPDQALGHWPRALQLPTLADLQSFPLSFWLTGESQSTLNADDRALLGAYLGGGGSLLASGDEITWDLCSPGSPNSSPETIQWVDSFFDITYELDNGGAQVGGVAGSDVGHGLNFTLSDAAANPDVVSLSRAGAAQFTYGGGGVAGALSTAGKRILYLGFDLADVPAAQLGTLLDNALVALAQPSASEPTALPARLALLPNQPNPFNPKTTLRFQAPSSGLARLDVLDLRGRIVNSLSVELTAGENALSFTAVDAAGRALPSGTYFYRVALNGETASGKMTLLK